MAILGKVRYNFKGEWVAFAPYMVDDVVIYKNRTYRCNAVTNSGTTPRLDPTSWFPMVTSFDDMGIWNSTTAYQVGDIVTVTAYPYVSATYPRTLTAARPLQRNGATYICIAENTNQPPAATALGNNAYWQCLTEGTSKNSTAFGWPVNAGIVPANGVFETGASPGWAPTTAGPGDSIEDGGLGFANRTGCMRPSFINRNGGYVNWGTTANGSSGLGGNDSSSEFAEMSFPFNEWYDGSLPTPDGEAPKVIQAISSDSLHMVLMNNGEVYCWGYGGHGQNGSGNNNSINFPVRAGNNNNTTVLRGKKAIRIATTNCGHTTATAMSRYALMSDGTLWSWGYNGYGQLGLGDVTNRNVPTQITTTGLNGTVIDIWASGADYGVLHVLTSTGYHYSCGRNAQGQLGINSTTNQSVLTFVKLWGTGATKVKKFVQASRQDACSYAVLDASNQLWTWGYNGWGQLGNDTLTNLLVPTAVSFNGTDVRNVWMTSGEYISMYVTRTSSLVPYSCGYNGYYNLGRSWTDANRTHPNGGTSATSWDTYRLQPMVVETTTTSPYYGTLTNVVNIHTWQVDSSYTAVMLEQIDGTKYCGGYQGYGHFGFGHPDSYLNRARDSAGNTTNILFKRLRYLPSGINEAEFGCVPLAVSSNGFGALWYDKNGVVYYSGYDNGGTYASMRSDPATGRISWVTVISKLPGA